MSNKYLFLQKEMFAQYCHPEGHAHYSETRTCIEGSPRWSLFLLGFGKGEPSTCTSLNLQAVRGRRFLAYNLRLRVKGSSLEMTDLDGRLRVAGNN